MSGNFSVASGQHRRLAAAAVVALILFVFNALPVVAHAAPRLSTQEGARHLGLTRAWFAQVRLDGSRSEVERSVLVGDRLTVLTSAGVVQEFNALTGETLWIAPIGNPNHPSLGPAASDQFIALVNGSTLYVLDRTDGRPVIVRPVGGAPGAAPALARKYVFAPLVIGRIEGYSLGEQAFTPWYYQSYGRAMVPPLATPESIVWTTDSGHMYVGSADDLGVRFRLETGSEIVAPPAYRKPFVYAAAISGEVFALHEMTGARRWKYATGFPVTRAPAAVDERVFVTSQEPALHCIDATRGTALWEAPNITQFAAASRSRVYAVDELGRLVVLDAASGKVLGHMATDSATKALVNDQTDRIYLVSVDGLVQCLHELEAKEPLYHVPVAPEPAQPAEPTKPDATVEPQPAPPAEEATEEPEMPEEKPDLGVDDENPFDF